VENVNVHALVNVNVNEPRTENREPRTMNHEL
jgi:hypothetical protein